MQRFGVLLQANFGLRRKLLVAGVPVGREITGQDARDGSGGGNAETGSAKVDMVSNGNISPIFDATTLATEEAVINALVAADTMTGIDGHRVIGLPHDRLRDVLRQYNRLVNPAS